MKTKENVRHVGWMTNAKERLCFYIGAAGTSGNNTVVGMFLTTYLLMIGVDLTAAASVMLLVKIVDAVDDLVMGWLAGRIKFKNRWPGPGKYMPWLRIGTLILPISSILLFRIPMGFSTLGKLVWYATLYLIWDLAYTMCDMPNGAIVTTMTSNNDERNVILSHRCVGMICLNLPVIGLASILISEKVGVSISNAILMVSVYCFILTMIEVFTVKERVLNEEPEQEKETYSFGQMLRCLKSNKMMLLLYVSKIAVGSLASKLGLFVGFYFFGSSLYALLYSIISYTLGVVLMAVMPQILRKVDKVGLLRISCGLYVVLSVIIYFIGCSRDVIVPHFILYSLAMLLMQIPVNVVPMMIPDLAEYGKYTTGVDTTGVTFSLGTFVEKLNSAISSSLGLFLLGLVGWVSVEASDFADLVASGVQQSELALSGLWFIHIIVPAIGAAIMFILMQFYRIKDKDIAVMILANNGEITREEAEHQMHLTE